MTSTNDGILVYFVEPDRLAIMLWHTHTLNTQHTYGLNNGFRVDGRRRCTRRRVHCARELWRVAWNDAQQKSRLGRPSGMLCSHRRRRQMLNSSNWIIISCLCSAYICAYETTRMMCAFSLIIITVFLFSVVGRWSQRMMLSNILFIISYTCAVLSPSHINNNDHSHSYATLNSNFFFLWHKLKLSICLFSA